MKKLLTILICLHLFSCKEQPKIPVSNTLEIALGNKYSSYVNYLNKASEGDTSALFNFLKIDYIYDAAGYDHGDILFQLIKLYGDKRFAEVLKKMSQKDLNHVSQYFEVGLDANDIKKYEMINNYSITCKILKIK